MSANPIPGPYNSTTLPYHYGESKGAYSKVSKVTGVYYATGSNAGAIGVIVSGSTSATVTLLDGGQIALPGSTPNVYDVSVYSVDTGTVYLLYK